jgi:hypothetical protein
MKIMMLTKMVKKLLMLLTPMPDKTETGKPLLPAATSTSEPKALKMKVPMPELSQKETSLAGKLFSQLYHLDAMLLVVN